MDKIYVFVDVSKKQEFIFKSSKLKDNLVNSYIVKSITEYNDSEYCGEIMDLSLNSFITRYNAEKVYCGGGNSIVSFDSEEEAKAFIRKYSERVLEEYPDLELYLSKLKKDDKKAFDNSDRKKLIKKANELKEKRKSRFAKISFGVEKIDKETGFPVDARKDGKRYKRIVDAARANLNSILDIPEESSAKITSDIQDYKAEGGSNYIGIISLDGNGMGDIINEINDIEVLLEVSTEIRKIYFNAVSDYLKQLNEYEDIKKHKKYVTPIVSAGDDLCLILDARIAIDAAANIIENIRVKSMEVEEIRKRMKHGLTACVGVAIVKTGYPFFDAYKEAEKMCKNAKRYLHKIKSEDKKHFSIIDWKIVQGSNIEANDFLDNIKIKNEKYHIKPLIVDEHKSYYDSTKDIYVFSYHDFKKATKKIKDKINEKQISSSTLKKLQESFYNGYKSYELEANGKRKEYTKELFDIIEEYFNSEHIENKLGVIKTSKEKIYLLNDIIDSLKFINTKDSN